VGRICEAFSVDPRRAEQLILWAPDGWLDEIIEARCYGEAYQIWANTKKKSDVPPSPVFDLVKETEFRLTREEIDAEQDETPDA
jgi:hypothetical protein